jgi:hypothetical protein
VFSKPDHDLALGGTTAGSVCGCRVVSRMVKANWQNATLNWAKKLSKFSTLVVH